MWCQLTKNMAFVGNIPLDAKVEIQLENSDGVSIVALLWKGPRSCRSSSMSCTSIRNAKVETSSYEHSRCPFPRHNIRTRTFIYATPSRLAKQVRLNTKAVSASQSYSDHHRRQCSFPIEATKVKNSSNTKWHSNTCSYIHAHY